MNWDLLVVENKEIVAGVGVALSAGLGALADHYLVKRSLRDEYEQQVETQKQRAELAEKKQRDAEGELARCKREHEEQVKSVGERHKLEVERVRTEALEARSETGLAKEQAAERREAEMRSMIDALQTQVNGLRLAREQDDGRYEEVAALRLKLESMDDGVVTREELEALRVEVDRLTAEPSAIADSLQQVEDAADGLDLKARAWEEESAGWDAIDQGTPEALNKAIELFRCALDIRPRSADAYLGWGYALDELGRLAAKAGDADTARDYYDQACEKYQQALGIKPDLQQALNNWGNALNDLGDLTADTDPDTTRDYYERACEKYEQVLQIKPDDHDALCSWGNALDALGDVTVDTDRDAARDHYGEACDKYRQALDIKPDWHEALSNWGLSLAKLGGLADEPDIAREYQNQACEKCREALAIKPDHHYAWYSWGYALGNIAGLAGDRDTARDYYEQACEKCRHALKTKPDYHQALNNCGLALQELGKLAAADGEANIARDYYDEACDKYQQALEIKPDYRVALSNWGYALDDLGDLTEDADPDTARHYFEQAYEKYRQALEIKPDDHYVLDNQAAACIHLSHLSEGEEREDWLAEGERLSAEAEAIEPGAGIYNLACAHALQEREDEAFAELRQALEGDHMPWSHIATDRDWDDLREHPEYKKLEAEFGGEEED